MQDPQLQAEKKHQTLSSRFFKDSWGTTCNCERAQTVNHAMLTAFSEHVCLFARSKDAVRLHGGHRYNGGDQYY